MQAIIMQEIFEMLKNKKELKNIKIFTNLEGDKVVKYDYDNEIYVVDIFKHDLFK